MLSEARVRRILYPAAALLILAYFLFFTWRSLHLFFDADDMMNIYKAWVIPFSRLLRDVAEFWSDAYRPLGGLFFYGFFRVFGFDPVPLRVACLVISVVNLGLCFWFVRMISESDRVSALAVLLFAFHVRLIEVWFRTAVAYDLLCFTFFYLALCLYIQVRRKGRTPGPVRMVAMAFCFVLALDAKEHAVALPAILLAYEVLFHRLRWKNLWFPAALGLLNIPYIVGKTVGTGAMTNNPAYRPEYSFERFAHSWALFLNYLLIQPDTITPKIAMWLLAGFLCLGAVLRSRALLLSWILLFVATAPMAFLVYRGGFVLYIAYVGWCLYAAVLLVRLQDLLTARIPRYRTAVACGVFVVAGWRFGKINLHDLRTDPKPWLYDPPRMIESMFRQIGDLQPELPRGARVLLIDDPFAPGDWTPWFLLKLMYEDPTLTVSRTKWMKTVPADPNDYSFVFTVRNGRYIRLNPKK